MPDVILILPFYILLIVLIEERIAMSAPHTNTKSHNHPDAPDLSPQKERKGVIRIFKAARSRGA